MQGDGQQPGRRGGGYRGMWCGAEAAVLAAGEAPDRSAGFCSTLSYFLVSFCALATWLQCSAAVVRSLYSCLPKTSSSPLCPSSCLFATAN